MMAVCALELALVPGEWNWPRASCSSTAFSAWQSTTDVALAGLTVIDLIQQRQRVLSSPTGVAGGAS